MEYSLLLLAYYGALHALGPDHLSAIALFSIGKHKKEVIFLTILFAFTHGLILYIMALSIEYIVPANLLHYGDLVSSLVIISMGIWLMYLAYTNKIVIDTHVHTQTKHTHIYYKHTHGHDEGVLFSLAILMGIGGLRGMLVTLGVVSHHSIGFEMIMAFVIGVSIVFIAFGYIMYLANTYISQSSSMLKYALTTVGIFSIGIGSYTLKGAYFDL